MTKRHLHLLAYDVVDHRRRARVLRAVQAFGIGGQKSVHECLLSLAEKRELMARLAPLTDGEGDRLLVIEIDPRSPVRTLGRGIPPPEPLYFYIG